MTQAIKEITQELCTIALPTWVSDRFASPALVERIGDCGDDVRGGVGEVTRDGSSRWVVAGVEIARLDGLDASQLREATRHAMAWLRDALARSEAPHPIRLWNFLPGIHEEVGGATRATPQGLDRYRAFNVGRFEAFCDWFGGPERFATALPTATGVGHAGSALRMFALGCNREGRAVDNPRQKPAFAYSTRFGPRPPCFARATRARLPDDDYLLVGGTASVRGEDSVHDLSVEDQWSETMANFASLFDEACPYGDYAWSGVEHARAYLRHGEHLISVRGKLNTAMDGHGSQEVVIADICRSELLVEVELLVAETRNA